MATLDRILTLTIRTEGTRNEYGEWVPGTSTDYDVWARRQDVGVERVVQEGGVRTDARRTYRIRWRSDVDELLRMDGLSRLSLTEMGQALSVVRIVEVDEVYGMRSRRRFHVVEVIA